MGRALKFVIICVLHASGSHAAVETEEELRAIEKAHSAVSEVEADFRKALNEALKKGELKRPYQAAGSKISDQMR